MKIIVVWIKSFKWHRVVKWFPAVSRRLAVLSKPTDIPMTTLLNHILLLIDPTILLMFFLVFNCLKSLIINQV